MKVSIYRREKQDSGRWQFVRVKQGRGIKTSGLIGPFYIRFASDGRKIWEPVGDSFDEAAEAAEQRTHALEAAKRGLTVAELDEQSNLGRIPIKTACEDFLKMKSGKARKTLAAYSLHLREFQEAIGSKTRFMDAVTADTMRKYRDWMAQKSLSPKTIHTRLLTITFLLKKSGFKNPLPWDEMPVYEVEAAVPFSGEELQKMFKVMTPEEVMRYKFFLGTGAREQEVSFAAWSDLDLNKGVFTVRAKPEAGFTPKSHESRSVPLPASLITALKDRKKSAAHGMRWVFTNENKEPERHFLRKLKAIAKRAGLNCGHCTTVTTDLNKQQKVEALDADRASKTREEYYAAFDKQQTLKRTITCANHPICQHFFLHRFRKTCATRWSEAGVPVRQIQTWLGHKDLTTTQRYLGVGDMNHPQTRARIDHAFGD